MDSGIGCLYVVNQELWMVFRKVDYADDHSPSLTDHLIHSHTYRFKAKLADRGHGAYENIVRFPRWRSDRANHQKPRSPANSDRKSGRSENEILYRVNLQYEALVKLKLERERLGYRIPCEYGRQYRLFFRTFSTETSHFNWDAVVLIYSLKNTEEL